MRKILITASFIVMAVFLFAQEGPNYKHTARFLEKSYDVQQKYGKDIMVMATKTTGTYDSTGYIKEKEVRKENENYVGKTIYNRLKQPNTDETLNFNNMNLLQDRWVRIHEANPSEYTEIQYSSRGKILSKITAQVDTTTHHQWKFVYNELGYASDYYKLESDTGKVVVKMTKFNWSEDPMEVTYYYYNDHKLPILAMTYSGTTTDTLIDKITYVYDDKYNLKSQIEYGKSGDEVSVQEWNYDDKNRLIQYDLWAGDFRYGGNRHLKQTKTYSYE